MFKKLILGALAISFIAVSCSDDDDSPNNDQSNLILNLSGLEELGSDFVYEGWIIVPGETLPISTGTFTNINFPQTYPVNREQLAAATAFVLSIEPAGETGDAALMPAATKLLRAEFGTGDTATVGIGPVGDFTTAAGTFFLRAPTDEAMGSPNNGNDENGVWFGTPGMPPSPNLTLPTLTGWKYEGWVVSDNGPISTGTFTSFDMTDDNAGDPNGFSGTEFIGPPLPGEDFLRNAPDGFTFPLDIRGRMVVISVEPDPDDSPAPFVLKPLVGTAGMDTAPATYDFELMTDNFPSGSVSR
ncbi:anti-sigma factor [Aquimarina sp. AU474]|uniref:anti-sigma factor n=1 Tax=Aquimarina sp. AU474 TaxID=2108529 RepID=UPI000D68A37C|nr:anti-sigma factor [Aquimarina sp. AU474]